MAGRPITVHTRKAQRDRERQRAIYAEKKRQPISYNPRPLAQIVKNWRCNEHFVP